MAGFGLFTSPHLQGHPPSALSLPCSTSFPSPPPRLEKLPCWLNLYFAVHLQQHWANASSLRRLKGILVLYPQYVVWYHFFFCSGYIMSVNLLYHVCREGLFLHLSEIIQLLFDYVSSKMFYLYNQVYCPHNNLDVFLLHIQPKLMHT